MMLANQYHISRQPRCLRRLKDAENAEDTEVLFLGPGKNCTMQNSY